MTMRDQPTGSADVVVGDAFSGRAVPWHLATAEWTREVRRVLRPGGLYAMNVIDQRRAAADAGRGGHAAGRVRRRAAGRPARPSPAATWSWWPPSARFRERWARAARGARTYGRAAVARLAAGSDPLTDDDAPADQLLEVR